MLAAGSRSLCLLEITTMCAWIFICFVHCLASSRVTDTQADRRISIDGIAQIFPSMSYTRLEVFFFFYGHTHGRNCICTTAAAML